MSEPFTITLIVVFAIHLIAFIYLYLKRRAPHNLILASAFIWLILYQVTRLWWGGMTVFGYSAQNCFRLAAWITTGLGLLLFIRLKLVSRKER